MESRGRGGRDPGASQLAHSQHARSAEARAGAWGWQRRAETQQLLARRGGAGDGWWLRVVWWVSAAAVSLERGSGDGAAWRAWRRLVESRPEGAEREGVQFTHADGLERGGRRARTRRQTAGSQRGERLSTRQQGSTEEAERRRWPPRAFLVSCNLLGRSSPSRSALAPGCLAPCSVERRGDVGRLSRQRLRSTPARCHRRHQSIMARPPPVDLPFARRLPKIEVRGRPSLLSASCQVACMGFNTPPLG